VLDVAARPAHALDHRLAGVSRAEGGLERYPDFPGHRQAREEARRSGVKWEIRYRERYGIDVLDVSLFGELGEDMRRRGSISPELRSLMDSVERSALED